MIIGAGIGASGHKRQRNQPRKSRLPPESNAPPMGLFAVAGMFI
jgi:hypothetical protein